LSLNIILAPSTASSEDLVFVGGQNLTVLLRWLRDQKRKTAELQNEMQ